MAYPPTPTDGDYHIEDGLRRRWDATLGVWVKDPLADDTVALEDISGAYVLDVSGHNGAILTLTGDVTSLAFTGWIPSPTRLQTVRVQLRQDATGGHAIDLSTVSGSWIGGTVPDVAAFTGAGVTVSHFRASTTNAGTVWLEPLDVISFPGVYDDVQTNIELFGHLENNIDPQAGSTANTLLGGGLGGNPNRITGAASLRTIVGGYDNEVKEAGASGIVSSMHSVIDHNVADATPSNHAGIFGGSTNSVLKGAYGIIVGGFQNVISASNAFIGGGADNTIEESAERSAIIGGTLNIARGLFNIILGGTQNETEGYAATAGGQNTHAKGDYTFAVGENLRVGTTAQVWGAYSAAIAGQNNMIGQISSSRYSALIAGRDNEVDSEYGVVVGGRYALAEMPGQAWASGRFTRNGDAQALRFIARRETTSATSSNLNIVEGSSIVMPDDTTWFVDARISARRTDGGAEESAAWTMRFLMDRGAGPATTRLVAPPEISLVSTDAPLWALGLIVSGGVGGPVIRVTGEAAKTIRWVGCIDVCQVKDP